MTRFLAITLLFFLTVSCAHYYKDVELLSPDKIQSTNIKINKNAKLKEKDRQILDRFFVRDSNQNAQIEILEADFEKVYLSWCDGIDGAILCGIFTTATLGIIPFYYSDELIGTVKYKDLKTGAVTSKDIHAEHTRGFGWMYWFRAWTDDEWKWSSDFPDKYSEKHESYFKDYGRWFSGR